MQNTKHLLYFIYKFLDHNYIIMDSYIRTYYMSASYTCTHNEEKLYWVLYALTQYIYQFALCQFSQTLWLTQSRVTPL